MLSVKTAGLISEDETADRNEDATMKSKTSKRMGNVALRTLTVYLKNGDCELKISALLDDASTKIYINADVAAELGLQSHPSLEGKSFKITPLTTNGVIGNMRVIDWSTCAEQWPYFHGMTFHQLRS